MVGIKIIKTLFFIVIALIITIAGFSLYYGLKPAPKLKDMEFGVTFTPKYCQELGLSDWKKVYLAILDDLGIKRFRLVVYWDEIEKKEGVLDFSDLDFQIDEAEKRGAKVILALGRKLPRWPECFVPDWSEKKISEGEIQQQKEIQNQVLDFIPKVIERYKGREAILYWQVENEFFFKHFGECPEPDATFWDKEIELIRKLDPDRKIVLTESGELSTWLPSARRADILGTSLYKTVWNKYTGYIHYKIPATFYRLKTAFIKLFVDDVFVSEMQAEPWGPKVVYKISIEEQKKSMDPKKLREIIDFTRRSGYTNVYMWGVEWWYWLREQGDPSMWNEVKNILKESKK